MKYELKSFYFVLYLVAGAIFLLLLPDGHGDLSEKLSDKDLPTKKDLVDILIDQIRDNSKEYLNNVWTTLATLITAIGLTLGSTRLQGILRCNSSAVTIFQMSIFLVFAIHAFSYWHYYDQSVQLMDLLKPLVVDVKYLEGFAIQRMQVIINLAFDTILFLLLVFIVNRSGRLEDELKR